MRQINHLGIVDELNWGVFGYDEIEMLVDGLFEHRIIFSEGVELKIQFEDVVLYNIR